METSDLSNNGLLHEMRTSQNANFAHLEGVLTGSISGLQKTLSELMTPLSQLVLKRSHTDEASLDLEPAAKKAPRASASGCSSKYSSAIAKGNNKHANRTNVSNISKNSSTHTSTKPDDPSENDLDYDEHGEEDHSDDDDDDDETYDPHSDSVSIPDQDTLDADVHDLLNQSSEKVEDTDSMLTQIQEDLLCEADTTDAVNGKLASIILGLWGQKLAPEKVKARLNKFLKPKNCDLFVPKCNKDIWSDKIDTMARQFDINMQKVQNMILHCTFGIISISDKALQKKSQDSSEIPSMSIDLAAILTNAMHEINQIRRDNMKPKLGNLAKLANDVSPNAKLLFGSEDDLNKRITKITATNTALAKGSKGKYSKNFKTPPPPISLPPWDEGSERGKSQGKTIPKTFQKTKSERTKLDNTVSCTFDLNLHLDIDSIKADITNYRAGNIQNCVSNWVAVSPNTYIMRIVKHGLTIDFIDNIPPITNSIKQCVFAPKEIEVIDVEIQKLLSKGVICISARCTRDFLSSIFTRPKKDGTRRMILNLSELNEFVVYQHFKME